ncbi:MAG: methyl-accepting chemotaxis protein [Desulfobacterales bacterium]|nr:methyl-accepting chemotaxis protein [Desulfobacterales bacterium]
MKRWTIKKKLVISFGLVALLPVAALMAVVALNVSSYSKALFVNAAGNEMKQVDKAISLFVENIKQTAGFLADAELTHQTDESLMNYVGVPEGTTFDPEEMGGLSASIYKFFGGQPRVNPSIIEVYMGSRWGGWASSSKEIMPAGYDPRTRPWYVDAERAGVPIITPAYRSMTAGDVAVVTVAAPISNLDDASGKALGVVGIDVSLGVLTDMVQEIHIGESGYAMLVQDDGTILANPAEPETNFKTMETSGVKALQDLSGISSGHVEVEKGGVRYLAKVYTSPVLGWKLVGFIEVDEVMSKCRTVIGMVAALGFVIFLVVLICGFWLASAITRPILFTSEMLRDIAEGEGDLTRRLEVDSQDELGVLAMWFNAFVEKIQGVMRTLVENAEAVRISGSQLSDLSVTMSDGAQSMTQRAQEVSGFAEDMNASMQGVSASSEQTSANVNAVAASTEEMRATISEIAENSERARHVASNMVGQAKEVGAIMDTLGKAVSEIGKVTETINEISEQTNLLALNATIEAARAGEYGKGFAVVAGEIKALASQTAEATGEIRKKIEGVQGSTGSSVEGINRMALVIDEVSELVGTIATAVEEQSASTAEIAENLSQASCGLEETASQVAETAHVSDGISSDMAGVSQSANDFYKGSTTVNQRADELVLLAAKLHEVSGRFKI